MTEKKEESQGNKFDRYWIKDIELAYDCKKQSMWMTQGDEVMLEWHSSDINCDDWLLYIHSDQIENPSTIKSLPHPKPKVTVGDL